MTDLSLDELLDFACSAAIAGGNELAAQYGKVKADGVQRKSLGDYASRADLAAEQAIAEVLSKAGDTFGFLGEETGVQRAGAARRWVVDPLDGTTNFIWAIPYFAVSIALCDEKGELLGAVYDPLREEMFTAVRDQGARLNGHLLPKRIEKQPEDAVISISMPVRGQLKVMPREAYFRSMDKITDMTAGIRRLGSAALDLAYVAAGRLDGYFEDGLSYYDYAAGKLLAQEAGALVTSFAGDTPTDGGSILSAEPTLHHWLSRALRG